MIPEVFWVMHLLVPMCVYFLFKHEIEEERSKVYFENLDGECKYKYATDFLDGYIINLMGKKDARRYYDDDFGSIESITKVSTLNDDFTAVTYLKRAATFYYYAGFEPDRIKYRQGPEFSNDNNPGLYKTKY